MEDSPEGYMTIEAYLHCTNPYRSTTIPNPTPYPVYFQNEPPEFKQQFTKYYPDVENILEGHGFPSIHGWAGEENPYNRKGAFSIGQMTKPGYPGTEEPIHTFYIFFFEGGLPKDLRPARDDIWKFFQSRELSIHVEIAVRELSQDRIHPISPTALSVAVYKSAKGNIIRTLRRELHSQCKGVSLFNVGWNEEKVIPTIVTFVDHGTSRNWAYLRKELLDLNTEDPNIDHAFYPGGIATLMDFKNSCREFGLKPAASPGSSISIKNILSSGTLGGYFELKYEDEVRRGFLTSHHVIFPKESEKLPVASRFGASPYAQESRLEIVSISSEDKLKLFKNVNRVLKDHRDQTTELIAKRDELNSLGKSDERINEKIAKFDGSVKGYEQKIEMTRSISQSLGKVFLSSGMAVYNNRIADWAFIGNTRPHTLFTKYHARLQVTRFGELCVQAIHR